MATRRWSWTSQVQIRARSSEVSDLQQIWFCFGDDNDKSQTPLSLRHFIHFVQNFFFLTWKTKTKATLGFLAGVSLFLLMWKPKVFIAPNEPEE